MFILTFGCFSATGQTPRARLLADVPFHIYTGGVIAVDAAFPENPRTLHFILDSGSSGDGLDSSTAAELGFRPRETDTTVAGIAGKKKVCYVFNRQLKIGTMSVDSLDFYISNYTDLSAVYGERIDGILGYAFLRRFILHVDFDTLRLQLYSPGRFAYGPGTRLHPTLNSLPIQMLSVDDSHKINFPFYLDTGAGLSVLLSEQFSRDSSIILPQRKRVIAQTRGLGGQTQMQLTVMKSLRLGPYVFRNVPAYIYDDEMNITAYPFTGGLLGNDVLRRFNVTFNYPEREINIVPNRHFGDEFDYAYTGITLYNLDKGIFVEDIIADSPAAIAGLHTGDEVISVGHDFSKKILQYNNLLQKAREQIELIIRRNGELLTMTITPSDIRR